MTGAPLTLMILGAGIYQVPLIRTARSMGVSTIVVSYPGPYPGFAEADRVLYLDTTDAEAICAAAREEHVAGIVTTGTDVAVRSIGRVCDELGLPGISAAAARIVTDKALMKEAFVAGGVSTSPFAVVRSLDEAQRAARDLGYPAMVKACDVSGSRGVTKVSEPSQLEAAFCAARRATRKGYVVVEGFVGGREIGVDGYVHEGRLALFAPHDKFVAHFGAVSVPGGHRFPLTGTPEIRARVKEQLERCIAAAGLDECAVNGDFMIAPDGSVSVIEVGGRCGATCIPELISLHTGIDFYQQMILGALGEPVDLTVRQARPCMAKLLFSAHGGTVTTIDQRRLDALAASTGASLALDVHPGDKIEPAQNGTSRWGQVIMATESEQVLDEVITQVRACVAIERR